MDDSTIDKGKWPNYIHTEGDVGEVYIGCSSRARLIITIIWVIIFVIVLAFRIIPELLQ